MISDRYKAFADEYLLNGMNGTQAYHKVYPGVTDDTAKSNAYKILTNTYVIEYLEKEKGINRKRARKSKNDKLDITEQIMDAKEEKTTDRLKAIEVHNKMTGDNEPEKTEITGANININYNKPKK